MIYTHVAAALVAGAVAFGGAWKVQDWRYGSIEADRLQALAEAAKRQDKRSYDASTTFEKDRAHVQTVFRTIEVEVEKIVDRPVYREQCFDADGVRALQRAIGETTPGQPGGTVPTPE